MKTFKNIVAGLMGCAIALTGFTSCEDNYDNPVIDAPVAKATANTTILELKEAFWSDEVNYIWGTEQKIDATPVAIPAREDGSHYVIKGRVISSDEAGNVFKSLVIQDETAALAISINSYNLYLKYRVGQEVVIDVTGMYVGKYNGLFQLGMPEWYANGNVWEASFMSPEFFYSHAEVNGWPDAAKVDTIAVNTFSEMSTDPAGLMKWQSQLVRLNNVKFSEGGQAQFSEYHSSGVNRSVTDSNGDALTVRTSGYSNFWNMTLPEGNIDLVCIASYYGTTGWQLIIIDAAGIMNEGNPTVAPGVENNPWTVEQAIKEQAAGRTPNGWVTGYIVGAVAPEVTEVKTNSDIEWTSTPILGNTLVIGATPDTKDLSEALVMEVAYGSKLEQLGALSTHPALYQKQIWIRGTLDACMGTYGIVGNSGASGTWKIEGVEDNTAVGTGDGTEASPYNCAQVIGMNPQSTTEPVKSGVWAKGYIVGWADMSSTFYINGETARFSVPATMATNILLADDATETDVTKCIGIQLPSGSVRSALNLQDNPGNLGALLSIKGDVAKYSGVAGIRNSSEYKLDGAGTPVNPPTPGETVTSLDETFSNGALPTGWTSYKIAGDKAWYFPSFNDNYYAAMTGYKGTAPFDSWLVTPGIDMSKVTDKVLTFDNQVNGYGSTTTKFEVYVLTDADPAKATQTKLTANLAVAPASGYSNWVESGKIDLTAYTGTIYIGFRYTATADANYATWCVDNVKLNAGGDNPGGGDDPVTPPTPGDDYKGDFNSFNDGVAKSSPYGTYTNATGWTATNSIVLGGTDGEDGNPYFKFIGPAGTLAPTLNGKVGASGVLTSPLLTGGIKTLTFSYGFAFSDTKAAFTINVKDDKGNVVKTQTVDLDSVTKLTAYSLSMDVNYTGSFTIEIVNDCKSQSTSNKDRVSIWNLTWN